MMGEAGFVVNVLNKFVCAGLTCIFALGGAFVGAITGAITGQTTETGFIRGAGIGTLAGAILAIDLFESLVNGDSLSKIDIIGSLVNGKIFMEWVSPAMLKAYQWQIGAFETSYREISDIFDIDDTKGLSSNYIKKLPKFKFSSTKTMDQCGEDICSICLQDFNEDDSARRLPRCKHLFHLNCIDEWLVIQGSCPICREEVLC
ncbi:Nep1-interacting protein [Thalictrum thalictroides]|uniref:Nep1-interacting protein n=1 Tax=Thalictrum thalictroides TaxID=46969 RepID=A0A7J6X3F7_THATH|nr:Nep1-interacting protein [Thalictrum thalictroides]